MKSFFVIPYCFISFFRDFVFKAADGGYNYVLIISISDLNLRIGVYGLKARNDN